MPSTQRAPAGSNARRARADRILDAAAVLLGQHGYRRVSIDDVAASARVGKGTIYLHWKTREALFWAVLQRESMRLLGELVSRLRDDPGLAMPHRLMPEIFLAARDRPLVRALLVPDEEVLGALAADEEVIAAQRELAGSRDYLGLLSRHRLLRPGLDSTSAGQILRNVMRGFFSDPAQDDQLPRLLAEVLARTLEADPPFSTASVSGLGQDLREMFENIIAVQRSQVARAY